MTTTQKTSTQKRLHMDISIPGKPQAAKSGLFLDLNYRELEERNLSIKHQREAGKSQEEFKRELLEALRNEEGIKAVSVCFSDMQGTFRMLDYDKNYLVRAYDGLSFDGSSISGFSRQNNSDLGFELDWSTFRWLPADIFGHGKILIFANVVSQDKSPYVGDYRSNLSLYLEKLRNEKGIIVNMAPEIEGMILEGENAEQNFDERAGFTLASMGGYFNSLPHDVLRQFVDKLAEAARAMAFENEKDHPEVAPAQFEMNYKYTDILHAADQVQIYKIMARQIAKTFGMTASFLPKPIVRINGNGMHTNLSLMKNGKNLFFDGSASGETFGLSREGYTFANGILAYANDICLALSSSVNAYRRMDPHFEAPNEIKMSARDRSAMIRIPMASEKSTRIEVRSVAPDSNPYLLSYLLVKAGIKGTDAGKEESEKYSKIHKSAVKKLPQDIYAALKAFKKSAFIKEVMTEENLQKYIELKETVAHRCPRALGGRVKTGEVWYHHEVTNQSLWNKF